MSKRKRKKKKTQKTQGLGRVVEPIHNLSKAFGSVSSVREEKEIGNVLGVRTKEEKNQNNNKQKKTKTTSLTQALLENSHWVAYWKRKNNPHILEIPANDIYDLIITFLPLKIIYSWKGGGVTIGAPGDDLRPNCKSSENVNM